MSFTVATMIYIIICVFVMLLSYASDKDFVSGIIIFGAMCAIFAFLQTLSFWTVHTDKFNYTEADVITIAYYTGAEQQDVNKILQENGDIKSTIKALDPSATDKEIKEIEEGLKIVDKRIEKHENEEKD